MSQFTIATGGSFKNYSYSWTTYYYKYVTFNSNGGTGSMSQQTIENSGNLKANSFTRSGCVFTGWNTNPDGSGTAYSNQAAITVTESNKGPLTLYAQWTFQGSGTENDPYLITNAADWNIFANNVNGGNSYNGKYFKLTADITVSTMVGSGSGEETATNPFRGTFDG